MQKRAALGLCCVLGIVMVSVAPTVQASSGCVVQETGFTPFRGDSNYSAAITDGVSVGVVIRNKSTKNVYLSSYRVNAYNSKGKLLATEDLVGSRTLGGKQTLFTGSEFETREPVAKVKAVISCSGGATGGQRLQNAGGEVVDEADGRQVIFGAFTNRLKSDSFSNVTFIMRDGSGKIIGGNWTNAPGRVPRGADVAWDTWSRLFTDYPKETFTGVRIQSSVGGS